METIEDAAQRLGECLVIQLAVIERGPTGSRDGVRSNLAELEAEAQELLKGAREWPTAASELRDVVSTARTMRAHLEAG